MATLQSVNASRSCLSVCHTNRTVSPDTNDKWFCHPAVVITGSVAYWLTGRSNLFLTPPYRVFKSLQTLDWTAALVRKKPTVRPHLVRQPVAACPPAVSVSPAVACQAEGQRYVTPGRRTASRHLRQKDVT